MRYNDANTYFKNRFGHKLYKVAITIANTCPNRDGTCGVGGCCFCSSYGSGDFAESIKLSITEQIDRGILRVSKKTNEDTRYIAYFQSFTSTHVKADLLRKALDEAISHPKVEAISIATRPDCLGEDIISVLSDASSRIPLFVELGLQTSNDNTAEWFNRGYKSDVYIDAVSKLKSININVITHIIFSLKGETVDDMMNSVRFASDAGTDGIKFTCLYVLKDTRILEEYESGDIVLPSMEEYFDIVDKAIQILPENVVVHRLTGDGPKSLLVAPMWTSDKRKVINYINKRFGD